MHSFLILVCYWIFLLQGWTNRLCVVCHLCSPLVRMCWHEGAFKKMVPFSSIKSFCSLSLSAPDLPFSTTPSLSKRKIYDQIKSYKFLTNQENFMISTDSESAKHLSLFSYHIKFINHGIFLILLKKMVFLSHFPFCPRADHVS